MTSESEFFGSGASGTRSSVPPNLEPGMRIAGKYELCRKVGTGAMGEVWAAQHVSLDEEVAIKIVLRDVSHGDGSSADSRFLLEARVASQLSRKTRHIVSVTDHGEDGPHAYLVMELLSGESLDARLARTGPMPLAKVIPLVYQIARALAVAHADGVVHRDLKPSNVFVTVDEEGKALIKILDFGIAKLRASTPRAPNALHEAKHSTLRGFLLGTPAYMSPEQARGKVVDHRADVWALAVIAYHLLTGEFPFDGESPEELFARLCRVEPEPVSRWRPDLPGVVGDLFARAFAERIDERFQSAVAFAGAVEQLETLEKRALGAAPQPMGAISLPPPIVVAASPGSAAAAERPSSRPPAPMLDSSIIAAGVPVRRALWPRLVAAAIVLTVLLFTASALSIYLDREPGPTRGLAAGASMTAIGTPADSTGRDEIPLPEPAEPAPVARAVDLPSAPPLPAPRAPQGATTTAALPAEPAPDATMSPGAAPPPAPPQKLDRSEVF
ncbi:MAG: serine/threonine protein kinase [Labilithrix sp.]|nr:serine/threonine protein kinase [Labilithrix sp.]